MICGSAICREKSSLIRAEAGDQRAICRSTAFVGRTRSTLRSCRRSGSHRLELRLRPCLALPPPSRSTMTARISRGLSLAIGKLAGARHAERILAGQCARLAGGLRARRAWITLPNVTWLRSVLLEPGRERLVQDVLDHRRTSDTPACPWSATRIWDPHLHRKHRSALAAIVAGERDLFLFRIASHRR